MDEITQICKRYHLILVEDAAEALGSAYKNRQAGTIGDLGIYSFNGNKTITCGAGGAIVTNDKKLAQRAKHLTTTAKIPHPYLYQHDKIGFNYRMPNLNAALACAQMENLALFLANKRQLANNYQEFFKEINGISFATEPKLCLSNYWLNSIIMPDKTSRNSFIEACNSAGIMTRPAWDLLPSMPIYSECQTDGMANAKWLSARLVNLPSSVRL